MEEMNSPGDEDARIIVLWLPLSVMLSGFFSPSPQRGCPAIIHKP
jgi:hypothetical protein